MILDLRPFSLVNRPGYLWHSMTLDPNYVVRSKKYYTGICDKVGTSSPAHLLTCSPTHLLTPSPAHPLTCSPTHLLTPSPAHPLTCSPPHLLTCSPTHLLTC